MKDPPGAMLHYGSSFPPLFTAKGLPYFGRK
ncbi:unnamed protein product, partial [Rotaria magnacalcarata]